MLPPSFPMVVVMQHLSSQSFFCACVRACDSTQILPKTHSCLFCTHRPDFFVHCFFCCPLPPKIHRLCGVSSKGRPHTCRYTHPPATFLLLSGGRTATCVRAAHPGGVELGGVVPRARKARLAAPRSRPCAALSSFSPPPRQPPRHYKYVFTTRAESGSRKRETNKVGNLRKAGDHTGLGEGDAPLPLSSLRACGSVGLRQRPL